MFQDVAGLRAMVPGQAFPNHRQQRCAPQSRLWSARPAMPGAQPESRATRGGSPPFSLEGQVCGLFAVDIVGFNREGRDDDIQVYVHRSLYGMLETAFDGSGVPWRECAYQDRGDGALVVIPPTISVAGLVHPMPGKFHGLVRRHNRVSCDAARIQLRMAAHIGPVHHDGHGFVGRDVNLLYRMLDAPALKRMLGGTSAEIAFITSGYLYESIITRRPSLADPAIFMPLVVRVKETRARAWAYTLGASPSKALSADIRHYLPIPWTRRAKSLLQRPASNAVQHPRPVPIGSPCRHGSHPGRADGHMIIADADGYADSFRRSLQRCR
jgi:hypothetical protein